jgi:hypothetical protein
MQISTANGGMTLEAGWAAIMHYVFNAKTRRRKGAKLTGLQLSGFSLVFSKV